MPRKRSWTVPKLEGIVKNCTSYRQVLKKLGLKEAGGNYAQVKKYIQENLISIEHFKGKAWNKGIIGVGSPRIPLEEILVKGSLYQSFKLKNRLFKAGLKAKQCEECGWKKVSEDGYLPLELDHINGDRNDNQIENLRILCPNCHSLKPTHRGKNRSKKHAGVV